MAKKPPKLKLAELIELKPEPNADLIKWLTETLEQAKRGEIQTLVAVGEFSDSDTFEWGCGIRDYRQCLKFVGMLEIAKTALAHEAEDFLSWEE